MGIPQVLFDAIATLEGEMQKPAEYDEVLQLEIAALVKRMKEVQRKLDSELTEIDQDDRAYYERGNLCSSSW